MARVMLGGSAMVPGSDFWIESSLFGVFVLFYVAIFYALVRILHRLGLSGWWSLMLCFWPVGLFMLAFCRWPSVDGCKCPVPTR